MSDEQVEVVEQENQMADTEQPENETIQQELTRDEHLERLQAENEAHEKRIRDVVKEMRKAQGRTDDHDRLQEESKLRAGLTPLRDDMPFDEWMRVRKAQIENGVPAT